MEHSLKAGCGWRDVFREIFFTTDMINDIEIGKRALVLHTSEGTILFTKRSLSQLIKGLGITIYEYRTNPELVKQKLFAFKKSMVLGVVSAERANVDWYAYRVSTEQYTPIPHRVLFDYVDGLLRENDIKVIDKVFHKWFRRTGMYWILDQREASFNDYFNCGILVTNANTAQDAIHVIGIVKITSCDNSIKVVDYYSNIHRGKVEDILGRVGKSVLEVVNTLRQRFPIIAGKIEELQNIRVPKSVIQNWLNTWLNRAPKKYQKWFKKSIERNINMYGYTELAVFQTETFLAKILQNKNMSLAKTLLSSAERRIKGRENEI